jgi:hypothetical protein
VKEATVRETDAEGRPTRRVPGVGARRSTHSYTLAYDYSAAPEKVSAARARRHHPGHRRAYTFTPSAASRSTDVVYELSIELVVPLPGFVKRRAEVRILNTVRREGRAEA